MLGRFISTGSVWIEIMHAYLLISYPDGAGTDCINIQKIHITVLCVLTLCDDNLIKITQKVIESLRKASVQQSNKKLNH